MNEMENFFSWRNLKKKTVYNVYLPASHSKHDPHSYSRETNHGFVINTLLRCFFLSSCWVTSILFVDVSLEVSLEGILKTPLFWHLIRDWQRVWLSKTKFDRNSHIIPWKKECELLLFLCQTWGFEGYMPRLQCKSRVDYTSGQQPVLYLSLSTS